ncbi:hypothetical protein [Pseudomonas petrae]|uniref:hypothetical protein n=1 Tax=Pseudomonas petrae TaxID=2912190 RepID=UPI001EF0A2EB|nr:hypothetical protein [Pseudomonas petrae]MCF7537574.1 hypothetical protein [Pseudomonas petrae]MCF7557765.1 hypothetical protein [Pseudomonas petrae]
MSNVSADLPRKNMTTVERKFLKVGNRMLLEETHGRIASAALMDIVSDWHGTPGQIGFEAYAKAWVLEGNAKNKHADKLLRDLLGLNSEPDPRKAA